MDAQALQVALGDHLSHGIRQRTDSQLQRGAVHHVLYHILGDLHLCLGGRGGLNAGQLAVGALHDHVHVADVDALVQTAVDPRQVLVDLQDHDVRLVQRGTGGGGGGGKVEVAVLVHGGNAHHGHVHRQELGIVPTQVTEHHGVEIAQTLVAELALVAGHVPAVVDEVLAGRVALHHLNRIKNQVAADLHVPQLFLTAGHGGIHQRGEARAHSDVDPVAALDDLSRLIRCAEFAPVFCCVVKRYCHTVLPFPS